MQLSSHVAMHTTDLDMDQLTFISEFRKKTKHDLPNLPVD